VLCRTAKAKPCQKALTSNWARDARSRRPSPLFGSVVAMSAWETAASLATAAGTLILAVATFSSVRSANRAARVAEQALMVNLRPLLGPSRLDDPAQKIFFQEGRAMVLGGARGDVALENSVIYLGISLRNAGQGIGVIHGWRFQPGRQTSLERPDLSEFRHQNRDLLIAPNDIGFWQGAFRDSDDPQYDEAVTAIKDEVEVLTFDLLYGDNDGGQRMISRLTLQRMTDRRDSDKTIWVASVGRHWNVDRPDPR